MIDETKIAKRFAGVGPELNERQRRLWAASEAQACGRGGGGGGGGGWGGGGGGGGGGGAGWGGGGGGGWWGGGWRGRGRPAGRGRALSTPSAARSAAMTARPPQAEEPPSELQSHG